MTTCTDTVTAAVQVTPFETPLGPVVPARPELSIVKQAFVALFDRYNDLEDLITQNAGLLPDYPVDGAGRPLCCDEPRPKAVTIGAQEWCSFDPAIVMATTNGWGDIGDTGTTTYLTCSNCWESLRAPENMGWE